MSLLFWLRWQMTYIAPDFRPESCAGQWIGDGVWFAAQ